jgi:hypothetical protein
MMATHGGSADDELEADIDIPDTARDSIKWSSSSSVPPASTKSIMSLLVLGIAAMATAFTRTHFCPDDQKVLVMPAILFIEAIVSAWFATLRPLGCSPTSYFAGSAFFMMTALLAIRRLLSRRPL